MEKTGFIYYGIDIALFIILILLTGDWILAIIVSTIIGIVLNLVDPISKLQ